MWSSLGVSPVERRLRLPTLGLELRVQEWGDGPPVLFVHGASNDGTSWAPLVARLPGFRCLVLDRPGCGLSEPVRTRFHDVGQLRRFSVDLVRDVLDVAGVDRAHLVGTSFGGFVSLAAASALPERVDRLALLAWSVGAPVGEVPLVMRLTGVRSLGRLMTSLPVNERAARSILKRVGLKEALASGRMSQEGVDAFTALLRHTDTMRNEIEAGPSIMTLRGMNESILLDDDALGAVGAPTLLVWGDADPFGGADVARAFAARLPDATLEVLPGVGHAPWIDEPHRVAEAVAAHLRS